ncbi:MAG: tRNA-specific adenosine deaminase [Phycisphaerae bacterium]|nr:tRNA-specific adenosine deaminase [Phycisphaerae bacterium]
MARERPAAEIDRTFMERALALARESLESEDVPVGAVVVQRGRIIGRGCNQREKLNDPTAHAEMLALSAAAASVGHWRLEDCTLYVTLEPCPMCAGAIVLARVARLVYGADDAKGGACGSLYDIPRDPRLNHRVDVTAGVMAEQCVEVLREFFRHRRSLGEK